MPVVKQFWQRYAAEREILRKRPRNAGHSNERGTPIEDQSTTSTTVRRATCRQSWTPAQWRGSA